MFFLIPGDRPHFLYRSQQQVLLQQTTVPGLEWQLLKPVARYLATESTDMTVNISGSVRGDLFFYPGIITQACAIRGYPRIYLFRFRLAAIRMRSAFSLMKPSASFWL